MLRITLFISRALRVGGGAAFLVLLLPPGHTTEETTSLCPPLLLFSMNLWFEEFDLLIFLGGYSLG